MLVLVNADGEPTAARLRCISGAAERARVGFSVGRHVCGVAAAPALAESRNGTKEACDSVRHNAR